MSQDIRTAPNRQRYEQARLAGGEARRNGKKIRDSPYRGSTALVRDLASEWLLGWKEQDMRIRGERT